MTSRFSDKNVCDALVYSSENSKKNIPYEEINKFFSEWLQGTQLPCVLYDSGSVMDYKSEKGSFKPTKAVKYKKCDQLYKSFVMYARIESCKAYFPLMFLNS